MPVVHRDEDAIGSSLRLRCVYTIAQRREIEGEGSASHNLK